MCMIEDFVKMVQVPKSKPIIAKRGWDWDGTKTLLPSGVGKGLMRWTPGPHRSRGMPREGNKFGFYGSKTYRDTLGAWEGTVALWGQVAVHQRGYRGEFGRVHRVRRYIGFSSSSSIQRVMKYYNG